MTHPNSNCLENMACPQCGQSVQINVQATVWTAVFDNGTDDDAQDDHDVEYDEHSPASCPTCSYAGVWGDFDVEPDGAPATREEVTTPPDVHLTDEAIDNYVDPTWNGKD